MTHDSRRYHRTRRPTFTRQYGALGALGSAAGEVGSAVGSTAGAIGSGLEAAGGALGGGLESALGSSGLGAIGQGLQSLFGSGGGEAGYLASLGQAVPQGVELAGPSSTFTGPGFMGGLMQGFTGAVNQVASPTAGTSLGQGLGQLAHTIKQLNSQFDVGIPQVPQQPIIRQASVPVRPLQVIPGGSAEVAQGPIMKLLAHL